MSTQLKTVTQRCRVYKICRSKMYDCNSTKTNREEMEVNGYEVLIIPFGMIHYHLQINWGKLNMYTINPKASLK